MTEEQRQSVVEHELGHACMAAVLSIPVSKIEVLAKGGGHATFTYNEMDRDTARHFVMAIAAGPACDPDPTREVPTWPLDPNGVVDERLIAAFAERAGITDEREYKSVITDMWAKTLTPRFSRLFEVLSLFMQKTRVLDHQLITEAKRIAWGQDEVAQYLDTYGPIKDESGDIDFKPYQSLLGLAAA